jgi:hypothetical protein
LLIANISAGYSQPIALSPVVKMESWMVCPVYSKDVAGKGSINNDLFFRRLRLGAKGNIRDRLSCHFSLAADQLGINEENPIKGKYRGVYVWNAYIDCKGFRNSDILHIHTGYLWAAVSREFNTSPWNVPSLDKSYATAIFRNFTTGKNNGIESGLAIGGNYHKGPMGFMYRTGMYYPEKYTGSSLWNPLLTGRMVFVLGDPEQPKYKYMTSSNPFRKRKGISLGTGGSFQGRTNKQLSETDSVYFQYNVTGGIDLLFEYNFIHVDAEYYLMERRHEDSSDTYQAREWHVRIAFRLEPVKDLCLQPACMVSGYHGTGDLFQAGEFRMLDIGCNVYPEKLKTSLGLHYVIQKGSLAPAASGYITLQVRVMIA